MIDGGRGAPLPIQRTFLTARSVEFDALLIAGGPIPTDPRVPLMLAEAFRHAKAIGGWGDATDALSAAGCSTDAPSVVLADSPDRRPQPTHRPTRHPPRLGTLCPCRSRGG
jgi:catalase